MPLILIEILNQGLKYWYLIVISVLLVACICLRGCYKQEEAQAAALSGQVVACRESNSAFKVAVDEQNSTIVKLQREGEAAKRAVAAAEGRAETMARDADATVKGILSQKVPDGCEGALGYLRAKAGEEGSW